MRKCKIYASVALAALLAACSNEDFISNEQQVSDLGRPTTKVALTFDEDAVTRMDFLKPDGEGWQWVFEDGDKIGALLMDEWNKQGCGIDNFTITDYVHTNYPFIRQTVNGNTTWNTPEDAAVSEGNYFFYFPYDKTFTHRGLVGWSVNPDQKNYNEETGEYFAMQAIKDNQKWLGYKFVEHTTDGVNKVNFDFVPLFATPKFVFENMSSLKLQIERLVIRDNSNGSNYGINPGGEAGLLATSMMLAPATGNFSEVNKTWEGNNYEWHTAMMWDHAQRYINNKYDYPTDGAGNSMAINPTSTVYTLNGVLANREATYEYTVDFGDNYIVENGDDIVARLVMPGGLYQKGDVVFEALLYVKNPANGKRYVVRVDLGNPQTQGGTQESVWDDIVGDKANHFMRPGRMATFKTSFDATALQSYAITDFKVATTGELKWLLEESVKNTGAKDLIVTTFGKRVELNSEIADLLKANPQLRLSINGDITLTENAPADAINLLYFYNKNITTNLHIAGTQVADVWKWTNSSNNQSSTSNVLGNCTIEILAGGSLDTKANGIEIESDITNAGIVVAGEVTGDVENKANAKFTADTVTGDVTNAGELKILDKVTGDVVNDGTAEIANASATNNTVVNNSGAEMTLNGQTYEGKVTNYGIMTIAKNSKFAFVGQDMNADNQALNNHGTLNINADAESTGAQRRFYNDGTVEIADGMKVDFSYIKNYGVAGVVNVGDGAIVITKENKVGVVVNEAVINNAGTVHNINNTGRINVVDETSITNVTAGEGTIDNTVMGDVTYNEEQTCVYILQDASTLTVPELAENVKLADANRLEIVGGTLSWEASYTLKEGSIATENRGYFGKGVELRDVTVDGTTGNFLAIYTNGLEITGTTEIKHGELAIMKTATEGTKATITGKLNISNYGIFRGGNNARLTVDFTNGEVHNQGTVKNIANQDVCQQKDNNHWTGNAAK